MNNKIIILIILSLLWTQKSSAAIDAMKLALQHPYQNKLPLHWDNIASSSLWLKGIAPVYDPKWETHVIRLKRSEQSSFYLPAKESLRLYNLNQKIQAKDLTVFRSNGTGLLVHVNMRVSADGHSLILASQSVSPQIIHISHSGQKNQAIELAVMVSRQDRLNEIAPYRNLKALSGSWAWLSRKPFQIPEIFWSMQAQQEENVLINGPVRIAIKNRLRYEPHASELIQQYRIRYQLDDNPPEWLDFETGAESNRHIYVNALKETLGREHFSYIEIPTGQHRFKLTSDRNLYVQVLEQGEDDYLIPMLNEPSLSVQTVRNQELMSDQKMPVIEKIAQKRVRNNSLQSSGLSGTQLLKQAALQHMDNKAALAEARKLYGYRTFYRNLLPSIKHSSANQFNAYFVSKRLNAITKPQDDALLSKQHQWDALKRLGNAYFSPVASGLDSEQSYYFDSYLLAERYEPGFLKIMVDKRNCKARNFKIQMDQQPAQSFILHCHDSVRSDDDFVQSVSETALLELQKQQKKTENITLSHSFSANNKQAAMIPVAINEIALPQQVRQLKVWSEDNDSKAVNLALQIRAAKFFKFSEQSYLARLKDVSKAQVFKQFVIDIKGTQESTEHSIQQLKNDWVPLKRLLTGLYQQYKSSVAEPIPVKVLAEQSLLQKNIELAQLAEQQQKWVEALSFWTRVVEGSQETTRDQALLSQAAILSHLSEDYLAQNIWRYLSLYAQAEIADQAEYRLLGLYKKQQNNPAIQMLAAAMLIHRPDMTKLHLLMQALLENQQYRFILVLGLMDSEPQIELMLKAAYQLQWWQTYQQLISELAENKRWFWLGLKAQKMGNYQQALNHWKKSESEEWWSQLKKGMAIRSQLSENGQFSKIYSDWLQWQQLHPGGKVWQDGSGYVRDAFGTDQYYSVERDLYSKAFRGTIDRPVSIEVMGPVKLSFKFRVLHNTVDSQLDGWISIKDNQDSYRYPFSNSTPSSGLILTGDGDYMLGKLITFEYQVGEGFHKIKLFSELAPVSVSIYEQQVELPLTVLAPLKLDSFLEALTPTDLTENQLKKMIPVKPSVSTAISKHSLTLKALLELPEAENAGDAEIRMIQCLAVMERQEENTTPVLFVADKLHRQYPENNMVQTMWSRISRYSKWHSANSIANNGGIRFIDTQGWQPASPALSIRRALIGQANQDEHVLYSDHRLLMIMTNLEDRKVDVEALLDDISVLPDSPVQLHYQIDNRQSQQLTISNTDGWKKFVLSVPAGQHQIRFWLAKQVGNQFLKLRLRDGVSDMTVSQERAFFISTRTDPLQLYINGPALIRIDEWLDGKVTPRFQYITEDWQLLTIPPDNKQKESLLKVWQRVAHGEPKQLATREVQRKLAEVKSPKIQHQTQSLAESRMINNDFKLNSQKFGTWSIATDFVRRNNVEEDSSNAVPVNFLQFRIDHRYFDEFRNSYWNTQAFVRGREYGSPSFGVKQSLTLLSENWPVTVNFEAKTITQIVDKDPEWLGQFKVALSQSAHLTPKTILIPKISWFGRYMSIRNSGKVFKDGSFKNQNLIKEVDLDLYTAYKSQHSSGLSASFKMVHDPWLDTRWTAQIKSFSNENMNFFNPDHFSTEAHWQQLLGNVGLDASYRINFYQQDKDRVSSSKRHFTKLRLNWPFWTKKWDRFEVNTQYNYDIDNKSHLGMLSFSYFFSESKGYRDFKPGEIDFRNIRERQKLDE